MGHVYFKHGQYWRRAMRDARRHKGLTASQTGELIGVSQQAISKWELGQAAPCRDKLQDIASFLGLPLHIFEVWDSEEVGSLFRAAREGLGLTRKNLVESSFLSERTILRIETGQTSPSLEDFELLFRALLLSCRSREQADELLRPLLELYKDNTGNLPLVA